MRLLERIKSWWISRGCRSRAGWYGCELEYGHEGRHEFVKSVTTTNGVETGSTTVHWD